MKRNPDIWQGRNIQGGVGEKKESEREGDSV